MRLRFLVELLKKQSLQEGSITVNKYSVPVYRQENVQRFVETHTRLCLIINVVRSQTKENQIAKIGILVF